MPYEIWMQRNAPPYLQDPYGQAWMGGIGATLDDYVQQYITGVLAAFPDYAPSDALPLIGDELGIDRGPIETDVSYAARLRAAWIYWKLAGTPVGLLTALYFSGFAGAVIVQQNGLGYTLSAPPVPGVDPTPLLVRTTLSALDVALEPVSPATKVIPSGTPWWTFDSNTDFCSRFAVLFPGPSLPTSFATYGTATFTGAEDSAPVVWNNVFSDTSYRIECGAAQVTDGGGPVAVAPDGTTKTTTGVSIVPSARFTGTVDCLAYQAGANPWADLHPNDLSRLRSTIRKWRDAKATCTGVYVLVQGNFIGWPVRTIGSATPKPSTVIALQGSW